MTEWTINTLNQQLNPDLGFLTHTKSQAVARKIGLAVAAGIAAAVLSACTSAPTNKAMELLAERRAQSLQGMEETTLDGRSLQDFAAYKIAMVLRNFDSVSLQMDDSETHIEGEMGSGGGMGAATVISSDGYLLAAAHTLKDAYKLDAVVWHIEDGGCVQVKAAPARIVWKSEDVIDRILVPGDPRFPPDFAIIHVDVGDIPAFQLADELPSVDAPVIGAGWGHAAREDSEDPIILSAGRILEVFEKHPRGSSPAWAAVVHDTPLVSGDSGGALLDREGKLIGIIGLLLFNAAAKDYESLRYSAVAYMPDPDWLREVIRNDRQRRKAGPASSMPFE